MNDPLITNLDSEDSDIHSSKRSKIDDSDEKTYQMEESKSELQHFLDQIKQDVGKTKKFDESLKLKISELM